MAFGPVETAFFPKLFDKLLCNSAFLLDKEVAGVMTLVFPTWSHCPSYEYEPRKETIKLTREKGIPNGQHLETWTIRWNT